MRNGSWAREEGSGTSSGLTLGTGVGSGLIVNGDLLRGATCSAGELGQTSIDYRGRLGHYGNRGSLEDYVGNREIAADARTLYASHGIDKAIVDCNPIALERAALAGDEVAAQVWRDLAVKLSCALMNCCYLLNPEAIIIGGGVAKAKTLLFEPLQEIMRTQSCRPAGGEPDDPSGPVRHGSRHSGVRPSGSQYPLRRNIPGLITCPHRYSNLPASWDFPPDQEKDFLEAMQAGNRSRSALVITPRAPEGYVPPVPADAVSRPWSHPRVVVPPEGETEAKPGSLPDYGHGFYYPLDLSSVWETAPLEHLPFRPGALPGHVRLPGREKHSGTGKSCSGRTHRQRGTPPPAGHPAAQPGSRCGFLNLYTQRLRPDQWAEQAPGCFDLILADAPCSGQSLLAKGIPNPGCFHPAATGGNAKRQRGILLAALQCLAPGGFLLYTTCTYAPEENERNVLYLLKRHPELETVSVPELEPFHSGLTEEACYRLMPFHGAGAGGFTCLLHKKGEKPPLPPLRMSCSRGPSTMGSQVS